MCIKTMINDGGMGNVLETADIVSDDLFQLNRSRNKANGKRLRRGRTQDIDVHDGRHIRTPMSPSQLNDAATVGCRRKPSRSLSELSGGNGSITSPAPLPKTMNLSKHTPNELRQVVEPLLEQLKQLDAAALLSLVPSKKKHGATIDPKLGITVPPIHDLITPPYDDCDEEGDPLHLVRYLHVREVPNKYSVGIFVFPPNTEIPLHDHPNMVVLSRILYGDLQVQSYDLLPKKGQSCPQNVSNKSGGEDLDSSSKSENCSEVPNSADSPQSKQSKTSPVRSSYRSPLSMIKDFVSLAMSSNRSEEEKLDAATDSDSSTSTDQNHQKQSSFLRARENLSPMGVEMPDPGEDAPATISAPQVTCLFPYEGNCHAFVAGSYGAAVLDVLLPPYDSEEDRDCTFYHADEVASPDMLDHRPESLTSSNLNDRIGNGKKARSYNLTPVDKPDHFHCLSGAYGRFGACQNYSDSDLESLSQNEDRDTEITS